MHSHLIAATTALLVAAAPLQASISVDPAAAQERVQEREHKGEKKGERKKDDESKGYAIGDAVSAAIRLPDIEGKTHTLGDYAGKVVVIDFWSIQCPWSIKYEKPLMDLHKKYSEKDVVFLAIDANHAEVDWGTEAPYARIKKYVMDTKVPYPILIDEGNAVADVFAARTTPHIFVIDQKGKLAYQGAIDNNPKEGEPIPYLANALDALLAGQPVTEHTTKAFGCSIKRVKRDIQ